MSIQKSSNSKTARSSLSRTNTCRVESIISVDERGQMVLPKELRDKAKIKAGDKFALVSCDNEGEICCLYLIKTEYLAETVRDFLGPMLRD
jgi:antitoxin PrlF